MSDVHVPSWVGDPAAPRPCNCSKPMNNGEATCLIEWDDGTISECHESCLEEIDE